MIGERDDGRVGDRSDDRHVVGGDGHLQRYGDNPINPNVLYDIDDVSDGAAQFSCGPSDWSGAYGESLCPPEVEGQLRPFFEGVATFMRNA